MSLLMNATSREKVIHLQWVNFLISRQSKIENALVSISGLIYVSKLTVLLLGRTNNMISCH